MLIFCIIGQPAHLGVHLVDIELVLLQQVPTTSLNVVASGVHILWE